MTPEENKLANRTVERIILERGARPDGRETTETDVAAYSAFDRIENLPQMGFSLFQRGGARHGFFFHNIQNLDLIEHSEEEEFLHFTHRGKAVTLRGRGLHDVFDAIMDHTLQSLYEFYEVWDEPAPDAAIIDRVQVQSLEDMATMAAQNMRQVRQ